MKRFLICLMSIAILACPVILLAEDGEAILKRADDRSNSMKNMSFTMKVVMKDSNGKEKIRVMRTDQKGDMRLLKFMAPASERGVGFLAIDDNTSYVYMPAFQKVRRIASHVKNQTFMGTDFSYEDMSTLRYGNTYGAKVIEDKGEFWLLELTPKAGASRSYSKILMTVKKDDNTIHALDYYDNKGEKVKEERRTKFESHGKYITPANISMATLKENHITTLIFENQKFDLDLPDSMFTQRNLKRPPK